MELTSEGKIRDNKPEKTKQIEYEIQKRKKSKNNKKPFIIRFLLALTKLILIVIIMILIACIPIAKYLGEMYVGVNDKFYSMKEKMSNTNSQSYVVDIKGEIIAELNGDDKRKEITLNEMSPYLPRAYVAIEDERFYTHEGIDLKRTLGAIYTYIKNEGESSFGGSSITQQLVKNVTEDRKDDVNRKIREWILAYKLEKELSKEEILEKYLNIIFVGSDVYGVELGSKYYFNKSAKDLSIAECAFMAGITTEPNSYNPFSENDNSIIIKNRTKTVLTKMLELNFINVDEYERACLEVEQGLNFKETKIYNKIYSYHTDETINRVIEDIAKEKEISYDLAEEYVYTGGIIIYSTQDTYIQNIITEELKKETYAKSSVKHPEMTAEAAMVIIEPKTGYVLRMCSEE